MIEFDTSDPKAVKARKRSAKKAAEAQAEVIKTFMGFPDGRAYFYQLLVKCNCYRNPFSCDTNLMAFSCGEQNIGLQILADLQAASPELYLQMMRESKQNDGHDSNDRSTESGTDVGDIDGAESRAEG